MLCSNQLSYIATYYSAYAWLRCLSGAYYASILVPVKYFFMMIFKGLVRPVRPLASIVLPTVADIKKPRRKRQGFMATEPGIR